MLSVEVIVAATRNRVMGVNGALPWGMSLKQDLARFSQMTRGKVVLMGRKTWDSLPHKPLPDRQHVVITSRPEHYSTLYSAHHDTTRFCTMSNFATTARELTGLYKVHLFVIGGRQILSHFLHYAHRLHITWVDQLPESATETTLLPPIPTHFGLSKYEIPEQQDPSSSSSSSPSPPFEFLTYTHLDRDAYPPTANEKVYLDLLRNILTYGTERPDRTGTGYVGVVCSPAAFQHLRDDPHPDDEADRPGRVRLRELLWFLRGSTDSRELSRQGVRIWEGNSSRPFLDARGLVDLPEGDIGAGYGFQWRHFGAEYGTCEEDYAGRGVDQIEGVVRSLREDPFGRRHVVSAWNPAALSRTALPPCHVLFQFYVDSASSSSSRRLSCHLYQRSVDCFLGLPFNILSYAILTRIIAMRAGLDGVNELIISTGDTHIYTDHLRQVQEQLTRLPCPAPILEIHPDVATLDWKDIGERHFSMHGYFHHEPIAAKMSV